MQSVNSAACGECSVRVQCVRVQCGGYSVEGTV